MTLQELQQAIYQLSPEEQLSLLETLVQALKARQQQALARHSLVNQLRGCLKKPGQPTLTDADVKAMQEERLVEKYLPLHPELKINLEPPMVFKFDKRMWKPS